ncbi:MAG: cache domain-containing protein [Proteobacteria bacterium]|nr:cache domain-containing protein [Pseudomonadota bacterium]
MEKLFPKGKIQKLMFWCLLLATLFSFFLSIFLIYNHISYKNTIAKKVKNQVVHHTMEGARAIDNILKKRMSIAQNIADDLTANKLSMKEILKKIRDIVDENLHIHGIAIAYRPYAYNPKVRLHASYYARKYGKPQLIQVESVYDYTKSEHEWYTLPMEKGAMWVGPYSGQAGGVLMTTYSVPFYKVDSATKEKIALGVVALDISLDWVKNIVDSLDFGHSGYGAVISKKGVYLYHPNREYVQKSKTIFDVAGESKDTGREIAGIKSLRGEKGVVEHTGVTTGLPSWLIFEPIPSAGWSLHLTFIKDDIPVNLDILRRQLMVIVLVLTIFGLSFSSLVFRAYEGDNGNLWRICTIVFIVLLSGIGILWHIALSFDTDLKSRGVKIIGKAGLDSFMHSYSKEFIQRGAGEPKYVPTGIFIRSAEFSGANKILMSGYIWQKYNNKTHKDISRGFILPDAIGDIKISEAYSFMQKDMRVIGWYFQATLYGRLDYSRYPVDYERLGIQIRHQDLGKNVILIPDLEAYKFINPSTLPGLGKDFVIPDWEVKNTFFEFIMKNYDTNFGIQDYSGQDNFPELYFNIMIKRNLVDAFIRNMTPLIIVALLLFAVMFIMAEEKMSKKFAMDIGENLVFIGSMCFVIIFSHINTRGRIPTQEIFYLEYFYFVIYIALLWVPISAILFVGGNKSSFIQYKGNLFSKLLYWPVILGALFTITMITFY